MLILLFFIQAIVAPGAESTHKFFLDDVTLHVMFKTITSSKEYVTDVTS